MASASQLRKQDITVGWSGIDRTIIFHGEVIGYAFVDKESGKWVFDPCVDGLTEQIFDTYKGLTNALLHIVKAL